MNVKIAAKIRQLFLRVNIGKKLMLLYLAVIALPLLLLSIFFSINLSKTVEASIFDSYNAGLEQLDNNLSFQLGKYAQAVGELAYNETLTSFLVSDFSSDFDALTQYEDKIIPIVKLSLTREKDSYIKVFTSNTWLTFSGSFIDDISNSGFRISSQQTYESKAPLHWPGVTDGLKSKVIGVYSTVKNNYRYPNKPLGILFLYFNEQNIYSLINKANTTSSLAYVVNDQDIVLSSNERSAIGSTMKSITSKDAKAFELGTVITINAVQYLTVVRPYSNEALNIDGWKLIQLVPLRPIVDKRTEIWLTNSILGLAIITLSFAVVARFSRNLSKRVDTLVTSMKSVSQGDTTVRVKNTNSDEIGLLYDNFNKMVDDLNRLINEVYLAEMKAKDADLKFHKMVLEKKQAELLALQNQINPHFLFNTLESIRMSLLLKGDAATAHIVQVFGGSFRSLITNSEAFVTVREEMLNIQGFIEIQKFRHEDKIKFLMKIKKSAANIIIPKLLIQPLVENAVFHGVEQKNGIGTVKISAAAELDRLNVIIEDNGMGMDETVLTELMVSIRSDEKSAANYALRNIYSRLKVLYGEDFLFEIDSRAGSGTKVRVDIPANYKVED